jgi:hypothetical protein
MFDYLPEDWNLHHPRLTGPVPMEMLSPVMQACCAAELSDFLIAITSELKQELGFGWIGAPIDGLRCTDLHMAYARSVGRKIPLPVTDRSIERTIFGNVTAALAARFWQAVNLVRMTTSCEAAAELELDLKLVDLAVMNGVSREACWYLEAELVGHTALRWMGYSNPIDSRLFTVDVLTFGEADAIILEAERQRHAQRPAQAAR